MRFTKPFWDGIADGSITVALRYWKRPTVVVGRPYRTGGGRIEVTSVEEIGFEAVTEADAVAAGYGSVQELRSNLVRGDEPDRRLYRIRFERLTEPDPRQELAKDDNLDNEAIASIEARLNRLDKASTEGPWTRRTLALIEAHPERRAPDLADMENRETKRFKLDVRKLKNLGLTESLRVGYRLSPRGRAFLAMTSRNGAS